MESNEFFDVARQALTAAGLFPNRPAGINDRTALALFEAALAADGGNEAAAAVLSSLADLPGFFGRLHSGPPKRAVQEDKNWPPPLESFRTAANNPPPFPPSVPERRIVSAWGGERLQLNGFVAIKLLRSLGCQLPVEVWFDGPRERDDRFAEYVAGDNVTFIDAQARGFVGHPINRDPVYRGSHYPAAWAQGYSLKVYAIAHSNAADVLWLDADCHCLDNPEGWFDWTAYRRTGNVFFRDPEGCKHGPNLPAFGLPAGDWGTGLESGLALIDRRRCWTALSLTNWLAATADHWFAHSWGDKDLFLAAWLATGTALGMVPTRSTSRSNRAIVHYDESGAEVAYHRAGNSKLDPWAANPPIPGFPLNDRVADFVAQWRDWRRLGQVTSRRRVFEMKCKTAAAAVGTPDVRVCRVRGGTLVAVHSWDKGIAPYLEADGYWESFHTIAMPEFVRPGNVVLDLGASYGYFTTLFGQLVGKEGRVVAFEPNGAVCQLLEATLTLNGLRDRVQVFPLATANAEGEVVFYHGDRTTVATIDPNIAAKLGDVRPMTVRQVRVDSIVDQLGLERVDFVKVDVEGAEIQTWAGMRTTLSRFRPVVFLEFEASRYPNPAAFLADLRAENYAVDYLDYNGQLQRPDDAELCRAGSIFMLLLRPTTPKSC
jgi:FkbM family methyltransferase